MNPRQKHELTMRRLNRALAVVSFAAFVGLGFLYLQTIYAAWLECPGKVDMQLIPRCAEERQP